MHSAALREISLPEFGEATVEPTVQPEEFAARLQRLLDIAAAAGDIDVVVVYGDREHAANLAFLTHYDPRFEESLLILAKDSRPVLLVGNEGLSYATIRQIDLDVVLYQPFSLMGQDRSRSQSLEQVLRNAGIRNGARVGVIDWKYFEQEAGGETWLNLPAYIADHLRAITGQPVRNVTHWMMNPANGLRAVNSVDQLAVFESAATRMSNALRRALQAIKPGVSEMDAIQAARMPGIPNTAHPILLSGERCTLALASPSLRVMELGDPISCAMGVTGALSSRAGFLVHNERELPPAIQDYLEKLVVPYFSAVSEWYQTVGIGVPGGDLHAIIQRHLGDPFFGVSLNPGHLIHLEEWVHSPIYAGSTIPLAAGMALQVDVIPATGGPYFSSNIEDGIALADAPMRAVFAERWPEAWMRIQARRHFMESALGIRLKPEVLPFSNLAAHLTPYLLSPNLALTWIG